MEITNTTDIETKKILVAHPFILGRTVEKEPRFRSCQNNGFQMVFSNGWMISVQFGAFNYCSNRVLRSLKVSLNGQEGIFECSDAEVAVFNPKGDFVRPDGFDFSEDVKGFVKPDEVSLLIRWVSGR
jgi:hypothetical protein